MNVEVGRGGIVENGGGVGLMIFYFRFYIVDCEVRFRRAFLRCGLFGFWLTGGGAGV